MRFLSLLVVNETLMMSQINYSKSVSRRLVQTENTGKILVRNDRYVQEQKRQYIEVNVKTKAILEVKNYEDIFLRNNVQWWTGGETYYHNARVKRRKQTHSPSCVFNHFCVLHLQLYLTVHLTPLSPASPSAHPFSHPILLALARFPLHTLSAWPSSARHFQPAPKT